MAIRETIQIGDPRLKATNKQVTDFNDLDLQKLIQDLRDTMYSEGLIGIAAPQIGENWQVYITEPRETESRPASEADDFRVYINPRIVGQSEELVVIWEACGSVLNGQLFGPVERPRVITIEAADPQGKLFRFTADGILSRVIQHEQGHMTGIEFTEISDPKQFKAKEHYLAQIRNLPDQIAAQKTTLKKFENVA